MSLICLTEIKLFFLSTDYSFNPRRVGIQNIYRFGSDYNYKKYSLNMISVLMRIHFSRVLKIHVKWWIPWVSITY